MTINVKPLGDRVLVQPLDEKEVNKGGIIIPDTAKEKPQEGTVVAVGTGKLDDDGKKIEFTVKVGDKVLIPKYGGHRNQNRRRELPGHAGGRHSRHHRINKT